MDIHDAQQRSSAVASKLAHFPFLVFEDKMDANSLIELNPKYKWYFDKILFHLFV